MPNIISDDIHAGQRARASLNLEARLRAAGDRHPTAMRDVESALDLEARLSDLIPACRRILRAPQAVEALLRSGLENLPSYAEFDRAYLQWSDEPTKENVETRVRASIRAKIERQLEPIGRAIAETVLAELRADIAEIAAMERKLAEKYSAASFAGGLRAALQHCADYLQQQIAQPLNTAWAPGLRYAVQSWFNTPLAECHSEFDEAALERKWQGSTAAVAPAPEVLNQKPNELKTAAEAAQLRVS